MTYEGKTMTYEGKTMTYEGNHDLLRKSHDLLRNNYLFLVHFFVGNPQKPQKIIGPMKFYERWFQRMWLIRFRGFSPVHFTYRFHPRNLT